MRLTVFFCLVFSSLFWLGGCASSSPDRTIAVVGAERITVKDFEDAYAKNNGGWEKGVAASLEERERFLDLLVKFKLKVQEARARGLLRDSSIQYELKTYGNSVATSYMLDKELVEPNIQKMFERRKEELRASHILVSVDPDASPEDTAAAFKRAMTVIGLIPFERFDTLAVWYSQDPSVVANHGDLGFFSGGRMIAEFEDAAYRLPVGEYTREPVRTRFGYHVIKVTGRRPASGPVRFSHILLRFSPGLSDTTAVRDSAWAIYNELRAGGDFGAAVQQYSQDPTTVPKGGDVGYIERYRLPESLASLLYNTPVGTVSEPVPFPYGYHLFKVTDIKPFPHLADIERDLRNQYQQSRYATDYQNYLGDLKRKHRLELNAQTMHELTHALDSLKTASSPGWSDTLSTEMLDKTLFTFTTESVSVADLVSFMSANPEFMSTLLTSSNVENIVSRLTEIRILEEEAADVPRRHPNFVELMKEYEDGVLLFRIEQDEVWSKVAITDSTLQAYYEENKEQYRFPDRVRIQEVLVASDSLIQAIYRRVQNGEDLGLLADEFTIRPGMKQRRGIWDLVPVDSHEATKLGWTLKSDSISAPFQTSDGWAIITPHQKDNARLKTYQEALPEITSVYREQASKLREQEWLESLKKKFGVNIQREYLTDAFRRKTSETP